MTRIGYSYCKTLELDPILFKTAYLIKNNENREREDNQSYVQPSAEFILKQLNSKLARTHELVKNTIPGAMLTNPSIRAVIVRSAYSPASQIIWMRD